MVSKHAQQRYKGIAAGTSSGLSIIGSIYILGRYWYARRAKTRAAVHHIDVTKELIHVLAWLDLVGAAGRCVGVLPTQTYDQSKGEPVTSVCQLQAFVITFGDVSPIAWNFLMAYNLYRWVCLGEDQQMLQRRIKWYICGTLVFTLTIDTLALGFNAFGAAGQWCWVAFPGNRAKELYWKLITLYVWVLLGGVAMGVLLVLVKLNVQKRLKGVDNDDARVAYHGVVQNLTIYIVAFIICWCPAVVDRGYLAITGNEIFTLSMLHTSIVPLQGFVNAVIYGKFHVWVGRHLQNTARDTRSSDKSVKSSESLRTTDLQESKRRQFGTANIFVTSFDMNWSPFPQNLIDWVPRDKDLYVFSLQHCVDVQSVEQSIRKHLLQINYPMGYRSITSLAGSMLRGHSHSQDASLCQIVFVNNSDIASGNFQFQTSDGRAWSQRKVFKGVVGIPMRYFEASLAFVSCNLDPISSNAQVPQPVVPLATKHASTLTMVESFEMSADRASVDFPYLYHHTILSGNLGYGVDMPRSKLIATIDQAYKSECLKRATDAALDAKLRAFGRPSLGSARAAATVNSSTLELANTNVPVEWNLLFFKTRGSLGRASCSSNSSNEDQEEYEEVYAADDDGVPFALLQSPARVDARTSFVPVSQSGADSGDETVRLEVAENEHEAAEPPVDSNQAWQRFLNSLFPNDISQGVTPNALTMDVPALVRGDSKKISDWTTKSQLVAQSCKQKWQDLVRHDELRAAIEAKEILCGFEEPPITFLPSFPRQVGAAASYSKLVHKSCKSFFAEASEHLPAYKDRVLLHSLPDTRQRIRNVGYWLCEEVLTSTHKPVCSEFELEVDRFFSYKNAEANVSDIKAGKLALRDKSHIQEYKIKLVNLDANIWTYALRSAPSTSLWRSRGPSPETHTSSVGEQTSVQSIQEEGASSPELRSAGPLSNVLGRMKRKSMHRSPVPDLQSPFVSRGSMSRRGRLESGLTGEQFDLVPVEPTSITTIFPLPSEDVYAMQRKVHEVAHSVQNGFQSSARDEEGEEASLAYTNFRSVSWKEALTRGVMHSAITKAVNGAIHVAIKIEGDVKTQGGQGILCIQERDLIEHAAPVIGEAVPIPFDVPLTWSGKHVGYLHGDILCGL